MNNVKHIERIRNLISTIEQELSQDMVNVELMTGLVKELKESAVGVCKGCGRIIMKTYPQMVYCSDACNNRSKQRTFRAKRKGLSAGVDARLSDQAINNVC